MDMDGEDRGDRQTGREPTYIRIKEMTNMFAHNRISAGGLGRGPFQLNRLGSDHQPVNGMLKRIRRLHSFHL